jgi:hypothetical protein
MPYQMPAFPAMMEIASHAVSAPRRIYPRCVSCTINPYIPIAVTLNIANAGYWPPPDTDLVAVETELSRFRELYNGKALEAAGPAVPLLPVPILLSDSSDSSCWRK